MSFPTVLERQGGRRSICVYCGAREGLSEGPVQVAAELGAQIARRGWRLVYGGARVGLMGRVATGALSAGGEVLGVIPQALLTEEVAHRGLSELRIVAHMHDRKREMAAGADAFIALPGGLGTLEELFEVWTWRQLGFHDKPIGLLNVGGYFDPLLGFLDRAVETGFISPSHRNLLQVETDADRLLERISLHWGQVPEDEHSLENT